MALDKRIARSGAILVLAFAVSAGGEAIAAEPFDLKGDRLGMLLTDFRAKYARTVQGHNEPAPFCSDTRPGKRIEPLLSEEWFQQAGIVTCRLNFLFEEVRRRPGDLQTTVANVQTKILVYHFVDDRLFRITVWLPHDGFADVKSAMVEKFGPPKSLTKEAYQNAFGAKFDGETLAWDNGSSAAMLAERLGDVKTSGLVLVHKQLNETAESRRPKKLQDL